MATLAEDFLLVAITGAVGVGTHWAYNEANTTTPEYGTLATALSIGALCFGIAFGVGEVEGITPFWRAVAVGGALGAAPNVARVFRARDTNCQTLCMNECRQQVAESNLIRQFMPELPA